MGLKGRIAWRFMAEKANLTLLQAIYGALVDMIIQVNGGNIPKVNEELEQKGRSLAPKLLARFADSVGKHAASFKEFKDTLNLAYKYNYGHEFTKVTYLNDENGERILYQDKNCPVCGGVTLSSEFKDLKYCNSLSGVFLEVLTLRGFEGIGREIQCTAAGAESCIWEIRCIRELPVKGEGKS
jgi:predicted hydrocarbon binding protein